MGGFTINMALLTELGPWFSRFSSFSWFSPFCPFSRFSLFSAFSPFSRFFFGNWFSGFSGFLDGWVRSRVKRGYEKQKAETKRDKGRYEKRKYLP